MASRRRRGVAGSNWPTRDGEGWDADDRFPPIADIHRFPSGEFVKKTGRRIAIGCTALLALFIVAACLGYPPIWDLLFGIAYCLDGYGGCPWS